MGPGQKILTQVGLGQFFMARVGSAIYGLGLNLENFPLKYQIFQFFSLQAKKNLFGLGQKVPGSKAGQPYLLQVKSKLGSGRVRAHLYYCYIYKVKIDHF